MSKDYRIHFPEKYLKILKEFDETFLAKNVFSEKIDVDFVYEMSDNPQVKFNVVPYEENDDKTHIQIEVEYDTNYGTDWCRSKIEGPLFQFSEILENASESLKSLSEKLVNENCKELNEWINEWENIDSNKIAFLQSEEWVNDHCQPSQPKNINFSFLKNRSKVYWSNETHLWEEEDFPDCWCASLWGEYNVYGVGPTRLDALQDATRNSKKLVSDLSALVKIILEKND